MSEIKTAYRKLSLKFHPDKNIGDNYYNQYYLEIQEAYKELSDNRLAYDIKLKNYTEARIVKFNPPHQTTHKTAWQKYQEEKLAKQKEREEWIRNNPPPKPFSDPIFKKKK